MVFEKDHGLLLDNDVNVSYLAIICSPREIYLVPRK